MRGAFPRHFRRRILARGSAFVNPNAGAMQKRVRNVADGQEIARVTGRFGGVGHRGFL